MKPAEIRAFINQLNIKDANYPLTRALWEAVFELSTIRHALQDGSACVTKYEGDV